MRSTCLLAIKVIRNVMIFVQVSNVIGGCFFGTRSECRLQHGVRLTNGKSDSAAIQQTNANRV